MDFLSCLLLLVLIISMFPLSLGEIIQRETDCVRSIKESLQDPLNSLSSWQFFNNDIRNDSYICFFKGIECWNSSESNRILNIDIRDMGLIGEFPQGISNCLSVTGLNLSNNSLYGSIPSNISEMMIYVTALDLSFNKFSGEIPIGIADVVYLNLLNLNNNLLTGRIPQRLATLRRLRTFSVANNRLSGPVPVFPVSWFAAEIYVNNTGLCGDPLDPCESGERNPFVMGLIIGWAFFFTLSLVVGWFIPLDKCVIKFIRRQLIAIAGLQWFPSTNNIDSITMQTSKLERFATRMSFYELSEATDNFSENNIIAFGETGTTYKGTQSNGRCLAINRLLNSPHIEHIFQSEIMTLGRYRHKNLVPLIGFCHEFNSRLIIYKFMPNGSLHDCLFSANINMEWSVRVRIAIGIAKGIAWLHQNRVVHRGINSKCILLDENFDPKICHFGKAITPDHNTFMGWNNGSTLNAELSVPGCYEEDVFGFGMVLVELITGRKHEEFNKSIWNSDMFELVSELQATGDFDDEMCHLLSIAQKCVECDPGNWPRMAEVYQLLMGTKGDDSDTRNEIQFA